MDIKLAHAALDNLQVEIDKMNVSRFVRLPNMITLREERSKDDGHRVVAQAVLKVYVSGLAIERAE